MRRILVVGAGLVSAPLIRYLLSLEDCHVTAAASESTPESAALVEAHPRGRSVTLDVVQDKETLDELVAANDLVVSLLPWTLHLEVANLCLEHRRHFVSTSYVSPAMAALSDEARDRGLLFLNEVGLDPGIDHMSAMQIIDNVKSRGGRVVRFDSVCGGLPAPDANNNPFGYKFSWSPRGVVLASRNAARFQRDGQEISIPAGDLFAHYELADVPALGTFEVYPNRDSVPYIESYGLEGIETMFRGTFRNVGWCDTLRAISRLGLLDDAPRAELEGMRWNEAMAGLLDSDEPRRAASELLGIGQDDPVLERLDWLGLFSPAAVEGPPNYLDALCMRMTALMGYAEGERDLVLMQHVFESVLPEGREHLRSTLIEYGLPGGDSAMARTVGLPAAIAAKQILAGRIRSRGVHIPNSRDIYEPIMEELVAQGIVFQESRKVAG